MLFTPSPPLFSQSVSSTAGNEPSSSSATHTTTAYPLEDVENELHTVSLSNDTTLLTNGPTNNCLLSTTQSPDQDYFYSPLSSSSSACPSIHLTLPKPKAKNTLSRSHRGDSCPVLSVHKKFSSSYFPKHISSSRNVLMATVGTNERNISNREELSKLPRGNLLPSNTMPSVTNPITSSALLEKVELETNEEQRIHSITPSPLDTPKNSEILPGASTDYSANIYPSNINTNRKVILNVGGIRHEGNQVL